MRPQVEVCACKISLTRMSAIGLSMLRMVGFRLDMLLMLILALASKTRFLHCLIREEILAQVSDDCRIVIKDDGSFMSIDFWRLVQFYSLSGSAITMADVRRVFGSSFDVIYQVADTRFAGADIGRRLRVRDLFRSKKIIVREYHG